MTIDTNHCITACNKSAAKVFGYQPQELVGVPMVNLFPGFPDTLRLRYLRAKERTCCFAFSFSFCCGCCIKGGVDVVLFFFLVVLFRSQGQT